MKRLVIAITFSTAFILFLPHMACDKHPVSIPIPANTPTPTATPLQVVINLTGSTFSPAAVTIASGNLVVFLNNDTYAHAILTDDGFFNCGSVQVVNNPGDSVTFSFPPGPVTINTHCEFHSSCGVQCDNTCTGMVGTIYVQ